jgi:hypothetical protein
VEYTELRPGDVVFFKATNWLVRLFLKYRHVGIYFDQTRRGLPLLIESIGRGVVIRSLFCYAGEEVTVMRPADEVVGQRAAKAAERLADNPGSWYGYLDIPRFALPRLILAKLGGLLPEKWDTILKWLAFTYRRNRFYICSELVASAYEDAGYPLLNKGAIPLPDDLARSPKLALAGTVSIPEESKCQPSAATASRRS